MEYDINIEAIRRRLHPQITLKLNELTKKASKWVSEAKHDLSGYSREMQMVPMYLELAT